MRKLLVGGNWKQNGTIKFAKDFSESVLNKAKFDANKVEVVVSPSTLHLLTAKNAIKNGVQVAAQNISQYKNGAYTGELSAEMLNDAGINWTILGHSERRHIFGETDQIIGEKVKFALAHNLKVIACIGEKLDEREGGKTQAVNERQLAAIRDKIGADWSNVVVAYEPVWAIGTGKTASPEQAQEVHDQVRQWLKSNVSADAANNTRILYGGSVTEKNADELIAKRDVDGFLVGGASLKEGFLDIIRAANDAKKN